jgi:hypothetical protein
MAKRIEAVDAIDILIWAWVKGREAGGSLVEVSTMPKSSNFWYSSCDERRGEGRSDE